ncbi:hypothetical protein JCM19992_07220 [Thermostilla marina]
MRVRHAWVWGLSAVLLVSGCAGTSGSKWSLWNPFSGFGSKKVAETKPYPQKPSEFATPTTPPGTSNAGGANLAAAEAAVSEAPLSYPDTSQQFANVQTGYQSAQGSTPGYATVGSDSYNTPSASGYDPNGYQPATPAASGYDQLYGSASSQGAPSSSYAGGYDPGGYGGASGAASPPATSPYDVASPYNLSPAQPNAPVGSNYNYGSTPDSSTGACTGPNCANGVCSVGGSHDSGTSGNPASLVGDRYAHLFNNGTSAQPAASTSYDAGATPGLPGNASPTGYTPGQTDYQPGNTGYVPGMSDTPPGSSTYQPGNTGYNPPGVPTYQPPYSINNSYTPNSASGDTSGITIPEGEYRPGSTKSYIPQSQGADSTYDPNVTPASTGSTSSYRF